MIRLDILKCKEDAEIGRNGTFTADKFYYGRKSFDGSSYMVLSDEGIWIQVQFTKMTILTAVGYDGNFELLNYVLIKNKRKLKHFLSILNPKRAISIIGVMDDIDRKEMI